jgi:hypothetical protein
VSYNGGNGGLSRRPTPQEQTFSHERHDPPVAVQAEHAQAARQNPELRASVNHGRPPIGATAKPGEFKGNSATETKPAGEKAGESRASESNAAENRAAEHQPAENKPSEAKAKESRDRENKPQQNNAADNGATQSRPTPNRAAEHKPLPQPSEHSAAAHVAAVEARSEPKSAARAEISPKAKAAPESKKTKGEHKATKPDQFR